MSPKKIFPRSIRGFSVATMLVGVAASAGVAIIGAQVIKAAMDSSDRGALQSALDSLHALGQQEAQSARVTDALTLAAYQPNGLPRALGLCLERRGTNCGAFATPTALSPLGGENSSFDKFAGPCGSGPNCVFRRSFQYTPICTAPDTCSSIDLRVQTEYTGKAAKLKARDTTFSIPNLSQ